MTNPQQALPSMAKIESISPKIRNKTRVPTLTTSIQHSVGSFGRSNQGRKRSKRNPAGVQPRQDPGDTLRMNGIGKRERERIHVRPPS